MATFEETFYVQDRNPLKRLARDIRLLVFMGRTLWIWATRGRRLRRIYRARAAAGETLWLDR